MTINNRLSKHSKKYFKGHQITYKFFLLLWLLLIQQYSTDQDF